MLRFDHLRAGKNEQEPAATFRVSRVSGPEALPQDDTGQAGRERAEVHPFQVGHHCQSEAFAR